MKMTVWIVLREYEFLTLRIVDFRVHKEDVNCTDTLTFPITETRTFLELHIFLYNQPHHVLVQILEPLKIEIQGH